MIKYTFRCLLSARSPFSVRPVGNAMLLAGVVLLSEVTNSAGAPPASVSAYWTGNQDANWSTQNSSHTNWATAKDGMTDTYAIPGSTTDVFFSATGALNTATTLDSGFTIKSLTVNDTISISGSNTLRVTGNTRVDNGSLTLTTGITLAGANNFIGTDVGQTGSVIVTGENAKWTATGDLNVGFQGKDSTLEVSDGGLVSASYTKIGGQVSSTGNRVTVTGDGSQLNNANDLLVGYGGNGNSLTLSNGGTATNVNGIIGSRVDENSSSNNNSVTVTGGSQWTNTGNLYIGQYGTGNNLTIADGGQVDVITSGQYAVVGDQVDSTGNSLTVTGSDSKFSSADFYLGNAGGSNTLNVLDGGTMMSRLVYFGYETTSSGNIANVDGRNSTWTISTHTNADLLVGYSSGENALNITNGGTVDVLYGLSVIGLKVDSDDNLVKISGEFSTMRTVDLTIGFKGSDNTLIVADNGTLTLTASSSNIMIAEKRGSSGTLQIGDGGAAGTVNADKITGGVGIAVVAFNHNESAYTFDPEITGSASVQQNGSGTTIFETSKTYTGTTDVNAGKLVVNGTLSGGSTFTVASGAAVAGTGSVTLAENQSMYINGVLSVGDFTNHCNSASVFSVTTTSGSVVMGAGSAIVVDLFNGAGQGSNIYSSSAADQLSLHGNLDATAGGVLYLQNPNGMTGFAIGDQWKVVDLNCGAGTITGTLGVNDSALGLAALGYIGVFDSSNGIVSIVDHRAEFTAANSGLPMANAQNQSIIGSMQVATGDVNNHLFNLRSGGGEESSDGSIASLMDEGVIVGQGDGPEDKNPIAKRVKRSREWEVFTTVNYGNVRLSPINNQSGVQMDSWASSVGIEKHISRGVTVGFAATFLQSTQTYTGGLGKLDLEGPTLSAYLSYVRRNFWGSLLYSFGDYDLGSQRNPGFGLPTASGATRAYTHSVQFNTGYNFRFQNDTLVTGPFVGIDYLHGSVDAYTETGGGIGALSYAKQSFESLVTRVGWSTSKKFDTSWAAITPQVRFSYERQNVKNNGTSVQSLTVPFSASGGNQTPGQDYMVIGAGVNFQFTPDFNMQLGYQTQIFRNNMESHFASVRLGYRF